MCFAYIYFFYFYLFLLKDVRRVEWLAPLCLSDARSKWFLSPWSASFGFVLSFIEPRTAFASRKVANAAIEGDFGVHCSITRQTLSRRSIHPPRETANSLLLTRTLTPFNRHVV